MSAVEAPAPAEGTFLAGLKDEELASLWALGATRRFSRGACLMLQGEPDDRVMILLTGRVKVARIEQDGRELMLEIRDPGDLLGELAFIDGGPRVASVTALETVDALVIGARALRAHLEATPRIAVVLQEIVAHRVRESSTRRSKSGVSDTMARLAARILELADRYGEPFEDGIRFISPLSQEDLAAWTGASRAGVAESLRVLRQLDWISTERRRFVVRDLAALRSRAA